MPCDVWVVEYERNEPASPHKFRLPQRVRVQHLLHQSFFADADQVVVVQEDQLWFEFLHPQGLEVSFRIFLLVVGEGLRKVVPVLDET